MKVEALTSFSLGGGRDVRVGDVFDLPEPAAKQKISRGWVRPAADPAAEQTKDPPGGRKPGRPEAPGAGEVKTRDPMPSSRDPRVDVDADKKGTD